MSDSDLSQTIIDNQLDREEIDALLATAEYVDTMTHKQPITIKISVGALQRLKIKAKQEGLPYQTYINSPLHKATI
ncbi:MAG: hypothetical protein NZL83_03035 [Candidatus Absconditabacterales bacterium]|nr:hypothetical protein [Candidatus Absconditabacterales bacterium]